MLHKRGMIVKNLSPEMIEKAKSAKSTEELVELSCVEKIELTLEDVKNYFEQINSSALNDELLDSVAGGYESQAPIDDDVQSDGVFESPFNSVSTARPAKTGCR